jgi:hypothetical protein
MNLRHWTFLIWIAVALGLVIWDSVCAATPGNDSLTIVARSINQWCDGLPALVLLALWIHVFLPDWMPASWVWK